MRTRVVACVGTVAVVLGGASSLAAGPELRTGNLDFDAAHENVRFDSPTRGQAHDYRVRIFDTCPEGPMGEAVSQAVSSVGLVELRLAAADTRVGKEVFYVVENPFGRSGPVEAGLVSWRRFSTAPCRRARTLFRYSSTPSRPPGAGLRTDWGIALSDFSQRYRGRELRLEERFAEEGGTGGTADESVMRLTFYRYDGGRDKHVRYRRVVKYDQTS